MIKTLGMAIIIAIVFAAAQYMGFFNIIAQKSVFFVALGIVIIMLIIALIVLGLPQHKDLTDEDEKK